MSNIGETFCRNGHSVSSGTAYCPLCGEAVGQGVGFTANQVNASGNYLSYPRATAGARFVEWLIDYGAGVVLSFATAGIGLLLFTVFFFVNAWYEGETGQTLGKRAMGLYVVDARSGGFIGGPSGIGRHLLHILDGLPLCIGYIVGLITGRTFADRILGTVVVSGPRR